MNGEQMGAVPAVQPSKDSALEKIAGSREVTEAQASIMVAKRFPRDEREVVDKVRLACQRPALAENALYEYAKGGTAISGPSIRMAETLIRIWGNAACGIRELESRDRESVMEAYAVDFETNVRHSKIFSVKHERATKRGSFFLEDPRERYENLANFGARRLRAVILALIPSDIVEMAVSEVERTLKTKADTSEEAMRKMIEAFGQFGVTKDQIEKRIQRRLDAIAPAQVVLLRKIYNSLRDGMSTASEWFESEAPAPKPPAETLKDKLRQANPSAGEAQKPADGEETGAAFAEAAPGKGRQGTPSQKAHKRPSGASPAGNHSPRIADALKLLETRFGPHGITFTHMKDWMSAQFGYETSMPMNEALIEQVVQDMTTEPIEESTLYRYGRVSIGVQLDPALPIQDTVECPKDPGALMDVAYCDTECGNRKGCPAFPAEKDPA